MAKKNFATNDYITSATAPQVSICAITGTLLLNGFLSCGTFEDLLQP